MDNSMSIVEAQEITYTSNRGPEAYCAAVNEKLRDGWLLFGPPDENKQNQWIKQYYVKINKTTNKAKVKD